MNLIELIMLLLFWAFGISLLISGVLQGSEKKWVKNLGIFMFEACGVALTIAGGIIIPVLIICIICSVI